MPSNHIAGDPTMVVTRLRRLAEELGAAELMIATTAFALPDRINNLELIAQAWSAALPKEAAPS
jgi:hypothetical protein